MRILIIDNYDSFTYNLVDMLRTLGVEHHIMMNDQLDHTKIHQFQGAILSPGPGLPSESGQLLNFVKEYYSLPMLGICLGHQAIAEVYGAKLINLPQPHHGKSLPIEIDTTQPIFRGLEPTIEAALYHSWEVDASSLPSELITTACWRNVPMAIMHHQHPLIGLQFHPESYATKPGLQIVANWLLTL